MSKLMARELGRPSWLTAWLAASVWNRRNRALNLATLDALALSPVDRVLEIGFGGGFLLRQMTNAQSGGWLAGVDISPAMVELGNRRFREEIKAGRMRIALAPAEELPFPPGTFTRVCSVNSIFYWEQVEHAFQEIKRVLLPAGRLVLCFTRRDSLEYKTFTDHIHLFDPQEVLALLRANGFRDCSLQEGTDCHRRFHVVVCANST